MNTRAAEGTRRVAARDLFQMTKPMITLLVVVTIVPSLFLATSGVPEPLAALSVIVGAALASASAAVFNQLVEIDSDAVMRRTRGRSLPAHLVSRETAVLFGTVLGFLGIGILCLGTNVLTALIAVASHVFYVGVYTMYLKRRTVQNIVIGGAAGAVGPLMGWSAVQNNIGWPAWVLALVIFLWTPPHFWALAIKYKEDYRKAGIPMYPVVHGDDETRKWIFLYTLTLIPCVASLYAFGAAGLLFLVVAGAMTLKFAVDAWRIYRSRSNEQLMPFFLYSCLYVLGVFAVLTVDRFLPLVMSIQNSVG